MTKSSARSSLLARRYVTALLDVVAVKPGFPVLRAQMETLLTLIEGSIDLSSVLLSPLLAVADQQRVLSAVAERMGADPALSSFVRVILKNRRGMYLTSFLRSAIAEIDARGGLSRAEVTVSAPLNDLQQKRMTDMLSAWSGKRVGLDISIKPGLIGGIKIRMGSIQIDDSISGKLDRLERVLGARRSA